MKLNKSEQELLQGISDLHQIEQGSFNIRKNGESVERRSSADIEIVPKTKKPGIDIIIKPNVKNKSVHIPVIISKGGITDLVYNDFYVGENSEVLIVAGCGIHNTSDQESQHNGIHSFHIGKNSKVKYVEKHLGLGKETSGKILNPETKIILEENAVLEMETAQLGGVTYSDRKTTAKLKSNSKLFIKENILTTNNQVAKTKFVVELLEDGSRVEVKSRSVAKDLSFQEFVSNIKGKADCYGHVECDGIIDGDAHIISTPQISALNKNSNLVHEAQVGKIAGEQLYKLMSLGLSQEEATNKIIAGYLK